MSGDTRVHVVQAAEIAQVVVELIQQEDAALLECLALGRRQAPPPFPVDVEVVKPVFGRASGGECAQQRFKFGQWLTQCSMHRERPTEQGHRTVGMRVEHLSLRWKRAPVHMAHACVHAARDIGLLRGRYGLQSCCEQDHAAHRAGKQGQSEHGVCPPAALAACLPQPGDAEQQPECECSRRDACIVAFDLVVQEQRERNGGQRNQPERAGEPAQYDLYAL